MQFRMGFQGLTPKPWKLASQGSSYHWSHHENYWDEDHTAMIVLETSGIQSQEAITTTNVSQVTKLVPGSWNMVTASS